MNNEAVEMLRFAQHDGLTLFNGFPVPRVPLPHQPLGAGQGGQQALVVARLIKRQHPALAVLQPLLGGPMQDAVHVVEHVLRGKGSGCIGGLGQLVWSGRMALGQRHPLAGLGAAG